MSILLEIKMKVFLNWKVMKLILKRSQMPSNFLKKGLRIPTALIKLQIVEPRNYALCQRKSYTSQNHTNILPNDIQIIFLELTTGIHRKWTYSCLSIDLPFKTYNIFLTSLADVLDYIYTKYEKVVIMDHLKKVMIKGNSKPHYDQN